MTNLDGPSKSQHPRPEHIPDVEYEDEPPGSYLGEFRIGWWKFAWSALNVLVAALVLAGAEEPGASGASGIIQGIREPARALGRLKGIRQLRGNRGHHRGLQGPARCPIIAP